MASHLTMIKLVIVHYGIKRLRSRQLNTNILTIEYHILFLTG